MPLVVRFGFLLLVLVFCGCFQLNIALLVLVFRTKGKISPNGNQALGEQANIAFAWNLLSLLFYQERPIEQLDPIGY